MFHPLSLELDPGILASRFGECSTWDPVAEPERPPATLASVKALPVQSEATGLVLLGLVQSGCYQEMDFECMSQPGNGTL